MNSTNDIALNQLIRLCKKQDRKAQAMLYKQFSDKMFAVCLRYANNYADAQDLFQEGFVKAFQNIHKYKENGSFEGWLRRLMVNNCMDNFRKKRLTLVAEKPNELAHLFFEESKEENFVSLNTEALLQLIQELPSQYRLVFNLYVVEDYSHQEIATELNISVGTSKSNLSRAKRWIRKEFEKQTALTRVVSHV